MKKKLFCILVLVMCFMLAGCQDNMDQAEIDRLGNLVNGTE